MTTNTHGLSVGIERVGSDFFLKLKVSGKLTHDDYTIINPFVESALDGIKDPKIDVLFDATELQGWELKAAWDDFKFGLKHGKEFKKIAIYGNKNWQEISAKVGSWFISGEIKYFEDYDTALSWLLE